MNQAPYDPHKHNLEMNVAREFLLATGSQYRILRAGVPPEPDVLCEHFGTSKIIGIEVVTAYYDNDHAKSVWKPARGQETPSYFITRSDHDENIRVLAECMRRIRAKCKKKYQIEDRLVLIVLTYPQRVYLDDMEERLGKLHIPNSHPFDEICIMSQHGEVYRLFPANEWVFR